MLASAVTGDWIPRAISDLRVYEKGENRLCLNPDVPAWIVTSEAAVLLLRLVDGHRSVDEIATVLSEAQIPVDPTHVHRFFADARESRLFDDPATPPANPWRERKLKAMHLHLTDRCNLTCTYCYRNSHPGIPIRHETTRFLEMFDFIEKFCAPDLRVTYCGGEPLLYPGFRDVVEAASRRGFVNELLTNGILITEETADFLAAHFRLVKISLDGADRETHALTRGDNFDKVLRGIHRVAARNVEVVVQVTMTQANRAVERFRPLLPEHVRLTFTPMFPMGRGSNESGYISPEEFLEVSRLPPSVRGGKQEQKFFSGVASTSCHAGLSNVSIADTGDVYPCHLFHMPEFHLGNVFHDSFEDIFYGERLRQYVHSMNVLHNNSICAACEMRFLCGGGCKANALHASGDYRGVDLYCSFIKESIVDELFAAADTPLASDAVRPADEFVASL
jgi:radical SAM protein with 4Fe4S-binding SPASM domain